MALHAYVFTAAIRGLLLDLGGDSAGEVDCGGELQSRTDDIDSVRNI